MGVIFLKEINLFFKKVCIQNICHNRTTSDQKGFIGMWVAIFILYINTIETMCPWEHNNYFEKLLFKKSGHKNSVYWILRDLHKY